MASRLGALDVVVFVLVVVVIEVVVVVIEIVVVVEEVVFDALKFLFSALWCRTSTLIFTDPATDLHGVLFEEEAKHIVKVQPVEAVTQALKFLNARPGTNSVKIYIRRVELTNLIKKASKFPETAMAVGISFYHVDSVKKPSEVREKFGR